MYFEGKDPTFRVECLTIAALREQVTTMHGTRHHCEYLRVPLLLIS